MRVASLTAAAALVGGTGGYFLFDLLAPYLGPVEAAPTAVASPEIIVGQASVVDGDTLEIHGTRIRLHGIDAPESDQLCTRQHDKYRCGQSAALALSDKIGKGVVGCEPRDVDRYGRVVAVCRAQGEDLNAWMVANGWALAYRHYSIDYVPQEEAAAAAKIGVWQGAFVPPWDWRRSSRLADEGKRPDQSADCLVKGNISINTGERIYHVPSGEYYSRTKINPAKGERWFCSEAEARAAGWRPSRR
ncbi:thermonuclease family protein [Pelagibius sp. 7325]|uniref:thermonuclease family protein n=1 Tax=Pelagibius sp. 7325 TaxID=3131994 RepID=UPI0030EEFE10